MFPLAQAVPLNFWNGDNGSTSLWIKILLGLVVGFLVVAALTRVPPTARRPLVVAVTFLSGLYFVLFYLWPRPIDRQPGELPLNVVEGVGFWLVDANDIITTFAGILTAFMFGLGVFSLMRIHGRRLIKLQKDWGFSVVLLVSMILMVWFGYADWISRQGENAILLEQSQNWGFNNYARDFLFEGLLQQMDAAMFSVIAFYILSAAYRAFRVRSVEASVLLATALIVMLSLMGVVEKAWGDLVNPSGSPETFLSNFTLTEMARWLRDTVQTPAIRGLDFGIGIGALAMALRLWLSLEKGRAN